MKTTLEETPVHDNQPLLIREIRLEILFHLYPLFCQYQEQIHHNFTLLTRILSDKRLSLNHEIMEDLVIVVVKTICQTNQSTTKLSSRSINWTY